WQRVFQALLWLSATANSCNIWELYAVVYNPSCPRNPENLHGITVRLIIDSRKNFFDSPVYASHRSCVGSAPLRPIGRGWASIIVTMNENEIPIVAGPRTAYMDVLVI